MSPPDASLHAGLPVVEVEVEVQVEVEVEVDVDVDVVVLVVGGLRLPYQDRCRVGPTITMSQALAGTKPQCLQTPHRETQVDIWGWEGGGGGLTAFVYSAIAFVQQSALVVPHPSHPCHRNGGMAEWQTHRLTDSRKHSNAHQRPRSQ